MSKSTIEFQASSSSKKRNKKKNLPEDEKFWDEHSKCVAQQLGCDKKNLFLILLHSSLTLFFLFPSYRACLECQVKETGQFKETTQFKETDCPSQKVEKQNDT